MAQPFHDIPKTYLLIRFQRGGPEIIHSASQFPGIGVLTSRVLCHVVGAYSPGSEYIPQPVQQETSSNNRNAWLT